MKKSGIILFSILTAGLLTTGSSYASVSCNEGNNLTKEDGEVSCSVPLPEGTTAYYKFEIARGDRLKFQCNMTADSGSKTIKTRIYGGKNAELSFKRNLAGIQQSAMAITSGKPIPITAKYTPSKDGDGVGQIKFSFEKNQNDTITINCEMTKD